MRRTNWTLLLAAGLLGGGIWALWHDGGVPPRLHESRPFMSAGIALLVLGAAAALLSHASLRRACARLARNLRERRQGPVPAPVRGGFDPAGLAEAVNAVLHEAQQSIESAAGQAKELEIQLKVATAERQHARAIIYSISDAVIVTDPYDELVLANDAAARAFGFELTEASRQPIDRVLKDGRMIELIREVRQSNSRSGRRVVEHQVTTPDGLRTFKVTLSSVTDRSEQPVGVVAVLHDMSREKELAQMRNDFVSSVSHELRTPLASIKAYVEMLIDGEAADELTRTEFYEVIHNEANRLERLIDNILNISRIEAGLTKVNKQPLSLVVIAKEAMEVIRPQAIQKQIVLEEKLTPAFYQTIGDRDMLYQAVLNLLSNAVKYTKEGGRITVETLVDEQQRKVVTRITDNGVGIPPKDLPYVFDKFYRSESNNKMAKGTGLGLSLVKHIIETVHQGRMAVASELGKGTTFSFELDLTE